MLAKQHAHLPPRSEVIYQHARAVINSGALDKQDFAERAIEIYHARTPAALRTIRYKVAPQDGCAADVKKHNSVTFWKFWEGENRVRLPVDMEEAIVLAMPEPFRAQCLEELAGRYGLLPTPIPQGGEGGRYFGLGCVLRETGEYASAAAQAPQTVEDVDRAMKEGREAMAAIASDLTRLTEMRAALAAKATH